MNLISLKDIHKVYKTKYCETAALKGVSLEINQGEMIAVTGPSGCGKSTLLNIIGLIDKPTSGTYILKGNDALALKDKESAAFRNKSMGFIYQYFALIKEYNVIDNIILPLSVRKISKKDRLGKAEKYLKEVGLIDLAKKYPHELSGGQQQRIAIARALAQETDVIIADEPTGNLDQQTGKDIMNLLVNINSENTTVIIVTHDENIVSYCRRKISMKDGLIINDEILVK